MYSSCNLEIVGIERIIAIPINLPLLTNFFNKLFRLPVLNLFCVSLTILKKIQKNRKSEDQVVLFIIPCKDEEKNITVQENCYAINKNYEFLFSDKSKDDTKSNSELVKK